MACWSCQPATEPTSPELLPIESSEEFVRVTDDTLDDAVSVMRSRLKTAIKESSSIDSPDDLESLWIALFRSTLSGNVQSYDEEMRNRGLVPTERVVSYRDQLDADRPLKGSASGDDPTQVLRSLWAAHDARDFHFAKFNPSSLEVGKGLAFSPGPSWPYSGWRAVLSLYDYANGDRLLQRPKDPKDEVWIQFEFILESGMRSHMRTTLCYDRGRGRWVPYAVIVGRVNGHLQYQMN